MRYGGLLAWDAGGRHLPVALTAHKGGFALRVDDRQAVYPITIDPMVTNETVKLLASDGAALDEFGYSVAVSGDTAVVGARQDGDNGSVSGSAYVFRRDAGGAGNWGQVKKLLASDGAAGDGFGWSVAVSGDTAVVGAPFDSNGNGSAVGSAYVFRRDAGSVGNWGQVRKLLAADGAAFDEFGLSVAVSGDTAVVGGVDIISSSVLEGFNGSAWVFRRDAGGGDNWVQVKKLLPADGGNTCLFCAPPPQIFGGSVAVSGDTALVGARGDNDKGDSSGAAYLYRRDAGGADNWGQVKKLQASDGGNLAEFGISVAVSGDTAVVGASGSGSAYVFRRDAGGGDNWVQVKKLLASDGAASDIFGISVAVSGDTAVVGAPFHNDNGSASGSAYVFEFDFALDTCTDNDGDGFGSPGNASCTNGAAEDCNDTVSAIFPGASEICDAVDNDCNAAVDDIAAVATTCGVGARAGNAGLLSCVGGNLVDSCNPLVGVTAEVCDGLDNDCNAAVDDNIAAVATTCGVGACTGNIGEESCLAGALVDSCNPLAGATAEVCDALDNDCNALVDDAIAPLPTTCGVGACTGNIGEESCLAGALVDRCNPLAGATAEVCDALDNDCNALVDDAIAPLPTTCGVGACTGNIGEESCLAGALVDSCNPLAGATAEVCDALDNDCNALVDDAIAPLPTTCGVGACTGNIGEESCLAGALVDSCNPLAGATAEVCDALDNDCNALVDDAIAPLPTTCGVGACTGNIGEESCLAGALVDSCNPLAGATAEVCDALDNDCNAVVDDGELNISANTHTVGAGTHPGSTKDPLAGIEVCAYDKSEGSCSRDTCGGISHQHYQCIVDSCGTDDGEQIFCCTTDANGECAINAPPGDYIVISDDATKTTLPDPLGVSASDLVCQELKQKHLQQIVKANGKKVPGKTSRRTGSELLVIEPEFIEWTGTQELYPFVFETVGDWEVTTAVTPPEGFVSDYDALAELVVNEVEAVQFTITDIGSDWVPTEAKHTVSHNGRRQVILSRVGVKLASDLAQQKGLDRSGHVLGQNGKPVSQAGFDPRAPRDCEIVGWVEPSPADPNWTFKLRVDVATDLTLQITRGQGLVVETLAAGTLDPGEHEFTFDGGSLGSGRYFVTLVCGEMVQSVPLGGGVT